MLSERVMRFSPSLVKKKPNTIDELLRALQKMKKAHGGSTLVCVLLEVPADVPDNYISVLYAVDGLGEAIAPTDSMFKGAAVAVIEARW